ncbi:hypothetical protein FWH09_02300 [Candidatus Saccharibacteria bacterium]|nr:hypothetical protein [Candidatus Saccharibacteria bacterium]
MGKTNPEMISYLITTYQKFLVPKEDLEVRLSSKLIELAIRNFAVLYQRIKEDREISNVSGSSRANWDRLNQACGEFLINVGTVDSMPEHSIQILHGQLCNGLIQIEGDTKKELVALFVDMTNWFVYVLRECEFDPHLLEYFSKNCATLQSFMS